MLPKLTLVLLFRSAAIAVSGASPSTGIIQSKPPIAMPTARTLNWRDQSYLCGQTLLLKYASIAVRATKLTRVAVTAP